MTTTFKLLLNAGVRGTNNIRRLGNELQGVQGKAKNLTASFKGLAKPLLALAGIGGTAALIKQIFGSAAELESQTRSLEVLTRSAEKTKQIVQEIKDFGAATPFQVRDLINVTKKLKAFGIETDALVDTTKRLGDVAGATGADLDGIATAFGQVRAKGKFAQEENLQLLERGVDLTTELKKMYGLSGDELAKAMSKGQISFEAANRALITLTKQGGQYFGGAISQADTLNGKLSTLQDAFVTLGQNIGKVLEPIFKSILDFLTAITNRINNLFREAEIANKVRAEFGLNTTVGRQKLKSMGVAERRQFFLDLAAREEELRKSNFAADKLGTEDKTPPLLSAITEGKSPKQAKEIVKMSQDEFDLRQAIRDAREAENEVALVAAEFALEAFNIGNKFNGDVLGGRNALLDAELSKNQALKGIERERAAAAKQAAEEAAAAQQALLEADPGYQMKQQLEELIKLEDQVAAGAKAIGNAFGNSFKSVIDGSKTAEQALADMMASVGEHFLDMAAQIIAKQIAMIIYGTIMKALGVGLGGGASSVPSSAYGDMSVAGPSFFQGGMIPGYAEGGYVSGPTTALVGEGGQGEYIIPEDRMRESMARYSRGARGSAVIPESGASGTSGEGGGAAVAAPIDVRFSVERINEVDYVTAEQFQAGMQRAAQQGAVEGERRALGSIRNSSAVRRRIGV